MGTGAAAGFGRIASILAPLLVPVLIGLGGGSNWLVFTVFAAAFAVGAAVALGLPERKNLDLTE